MKGYLQIKRLHSEKKDKDYFQNVLDLGGVQYFINLPFDAIAIITNSTMREVAKLPVGYESPKFEIDLGD